MYAIAIAGRYEWEGLGGQDMGCEWLAGLVWEGLGGLGVGCEWLASLVSRNINKAPMYRILKGHYSSCYTNVWNFDPRYKRPCGRNTTVASYI